jgi:hypothetical protein
MLRCWVTVRFVKFRHVLLSNSEFREIPYWRATCCAGEQQSVPWNNVLEIYVLCLSATVSSMKFCIGNLRVMLFSNSEFREIPYWRATCCAGEQHSVPWNSVLEIYVLCLSATVSSMKFCIGNLRVMPFSNSECHEILYWKSTCYAFQQQWVPRNSVLETYVLCLLATVSSMK